MRTRNKLLILLAFLAYFTTATQAQVTIGSGIMPLKGSLLDLKENDNADNNAYKGVVLPRVKLSDKNELYPMFLEHPELPYNPAGNPETSEYAGSKDALKKSHIGLIVYNLNETDEGLCLGLNQWNGEEWNCFQNKMGNAKFKDINCSDITVGGIYIEGKGVDASHYLLINAYVEREGAYTVAVKSRRNSPGNPGHGNSNGYSYYLTGVAMNKDEFITLIVPAQGKPVYSGENDQFPDDLIIEGLPIAGNICPGKVQVVSPIATYSIDCGSILVNGKYLKKTSLTGANTIDMRVTVSNPGSYDISTPRTNGISFHAFGEFTTPGSHKVTLVPDPQNTSNIPVVNTDFPIEIKANTPEGNATCSAIIPMTLPRMTYGIIGYDWTYGWSNSSRQLALQNFNSSGAVRSEGIFEKWKASVDEAIRRLAGDDLPDIILYYAYGTTPSAELSVALADYVTKGGCLIYGASDGNSGQVNIIMNGIFGMPNSAREQTGGWGVDDDVYQIASLPYDPIINGPFGNLAGKYWGEDNSSTGSIIMTQLPPNSVQICSAASSSKSDRVEFNWSIVWYNENKNFFYIGDSTGAGDNTSSDAYPSYYDNRGYPRSKLYGIASGKQIVYDAALEMNAITWAIKKAAISGINPH